MLAEVRQWAQHQKVKVPSLQQVGVSGSYARGTAPFGSDLDVLSLMLKLRRTGRAIEGLAIR